MRKGALNFFGVKNPSLFDTKIKIQDTENVEWTMDSPAIPESGTASVRARPTVKHHASSDTFQGFAVPTPKVPLLPPVNGPKANGSVGRGLLANGSVISVPDALGGEIFVPPPPSMAAPPPPGAFVPPPPDFMGDLRTLGLPTLQPAAQNPPPPARNGPRSMEDDFVFLKPPPMAPPKPPSTCSTGSASSIPVCAPPHGAKVPEPPRFSPPRAPAEKPQPRTLPLKTPPAKPTRLSSISNLDLPPHNPAPPPPVQTPTLSTFNPQNTAKLYTVPKGSVLLGLEQHDQRPKQKLLLEDTGPATSSPALVQVDGRAPAAATPTKPGVPRVAPELKDDAQVTSVAHRSQPEQNVEVRAPAVSAPPEVAKPAPAPPQQSPRSPRVTSSQILLSPKPGADGAQPHGRHHRFSPLIDRKLRNLKGSETGGARDGPAASPLALLKAAKERERQRTAHSLSRQNSSERAQQPSAHPSDSTPLSSAAAAAPRWSSTSSLTSQEERATPEKRRSPSPIRQPAPSASPAFAAAPADLVGWKQPAGPSPPKSQPSLPGGELSMPLLPPPAEFGDFEDFVGPPPSIRPPDPPVKKPPTVSLPPPAPPPSPPKPKPPPAPQLPPPAVDARPRPPIQSKAQVPPSQLPSSLSPSQATLLSILQKKMLEMDHKMAPEREAESASDDWSGPFSDEDDKIPAVPVAAAPPKNSYPVMKKAATLDMKELEGKMAKKIMETSSTKLPTSNGPSKHQYGMSFTIRPGTKQPITPVSK